jgi:hypothetical protein
MNNTGRKCAIKEFILDHSLLCALLSHLACVSWLLRWVHCGVLCFILNRHLGWAGGALLKSAMWVAKDRLLWTAECGVITR